MDAAIVGSSKIRNLLLFLSDKKALCDSSIPEYKFVCHIGIAAGDSSLQ
jgi:hypothetical protein